MLSFYGDRVVEEGVGSPAALVRAMLGRDHYGADVLKMACDCFQLRDGFRLDPANPLHQRILFDPGSRGFWGGQEARPGKGQQKLD
jgi:hypothetical protein